MELLTANNIILALLGVVIIVSGFLTVATEKLLHSAIYLFITLLGVAGLFLQMNYEFLAGVEVSVYAGGIVVLFIFGIVMVHRIGENSEKVSCSKKGIAAIAAFVGAWVVLLTGFSQFNFTPTEGADEYVEQINMQLIGNTLLGTGAHGYLLPFEATGILLLACIVGAIVIANKKKEEDK